MTMTGEKPDDDITGDDALKDSTDDDSSDNVIEIRPTTDVASTTKDDAETNVEVDVDVETDVNDNDTSKRKAEALSDGSPTPENAQEDEPTEPRAKKQKQEDPGNSSVDDNEEEEPKEKNPDVDSKSIDKNNSFSPQNEDGDKETNDTPMGDKDASDMEIEVNTDLSIKADVDEGPVDDKDGNEKNEAGERENDNRTKDSPFISADGNQEAQDTSTPDVNKAESSRGAQSTCPDANKSADHGIDTKTKDKSSNPYDSLKYVMVHNDGKPESLIKLVALKSLFSRQLPKMPRTYIARLVFDRKHTSLVILSDDPATKDTDEEVIGSICYRPFYDMRFAEIAFCAVNASHQVKGYGTKLMNLVKKEGARTGIEYFITYADNYAIGYFKKQGFTKTVSMPKGRYQGLIKEYDGGTMMECYVHPSIDFTRIPEMLAAQREFILSRIKLKALSQKVVYDPLPKNWKPHLEGVSRANESAARALAVPGMIEAGWTIADLMATTGQGKDLDRAKNALKSELMSIVRKVEDQQFAWPFREPVDTNEVHDYLDVIKEPIDLLTIDKRIRKGDHYKSRKMLYTDLSLMVNNCKLYNDEASTYVQCAVNLEKFLRALFASK